MHGGATSYGPSLMNISTSGTFPRGVDQEVQGSGYIRQNRLLC